MPKKTAEDIITSDNNYFLSVKGNQKSLHKHIVAVCTDNESIDKFVKSERNKGRDENREIKVYKLDTEDSIIKGWPDAKVCVQIRRWGVRKEEGKIKNFDANWYYISSKEYSAKEIYKGNRKHWGVETMHWVKDMVLGEDRSKIKKGNAPGNYSIIKNIVNNLFKLNGFKSVTEAIRKFANKIEKIWELVNF